MLRTVSLSTFVALLGCLVTGVAAAAPITYTLEDYPSLENGRSISGTITTDGTIGSWTTDHITAWQFTTEDSADTVVASVSSADAGALIESFTAPIVASATSLSVVAGQSAGFILASTPSSNADRIGYLPTTDSDRFFGNGAGGAILWDTAITSGDTFVIATAVPEPGTFTVLFVAVAGVLCKRRHHTAAPRLQ